MLIKSRFNRSDALNHNIFGCTDDMQIIVSRHVETVVFADKPMNRSTNSREHVMNKIFVKMIDERGYNVGLTYKKIAPGNEQENETKLDELRAF